LATERARVCGHFRRALKFQAYQLTRALDVHHWDPFAKVHGAIDGIGIV
jgi:hypothetical protein